jgi:alpha-tubulin suppressor-like RCC1 family protein
MNHAPARMVAPCRSLGLVRARSLGLVTARSLGLVIALNSCTQAIEAGSLLAAESAPLGPLAPFSTPIAASYVSSCALTSAGGVACWGDNRHLQLGVGDIGLEQTADPHTPVGLATGATAVFGGGATQCARLDSGRLTCWGLNFLGFLNGALLSGYYYAPKDLEYAGSAIVQFVAGRSWHCVLTEDGVAKCAGFGSGGHLGTGNTEDTFPFADVAGDHRFAELDASSVGDHMCGLTRTGSVYCWGSNHLGQLGFVGPDQNAPTRVEGVGAAAEERAVSVAVGLNHTCAVLEGGGVWCWGFNKLGQLGTPEPSDEVRGPLEVEGIPVMQAASAGDNTTCALATSSAVWCWGSFQAELTSSPPVEVVPADFGATAISCGGLHSCAINAVHEIRCWGENGQGQTAGGELSL